MSAHVQEEWFPFVRCLEASSGFDVQKRASDCAKTADLAWKDIHTCAKGESPQASSALRSRAVMQPLRLASAALTLTVGRSFMDAPSAIDRSVHAACGMLSQVQDSGGYRNTGWMNIA